MGKFDFSKFGKNVKDKFSEYSPEILIGLGLAGMVSSTVLAVKATPKALDLIAEKKKEDDVDELSKVDIFKLCYKCYIPSAISAAVSMSFIIGANSVYSRRNAVLATAYKLSENAFTEYREKVIETVGEKKEQEVRDKIAKDKLEKNPVQSSQVIITDKGNTLCYDAISGRYFRCDIDKIRRAEHTLNKKLINEMYVSLNEFYDLVGLPYVQIGFDLGWNIDCGSIEIEFSSQLAEDDSPCLVIDYSVQPKQNYQSLM